MTNNEKNEFEKLVEEVDTTFKTIKTWKCDKNAFPGLKAFFEHANHIEKHVKLYKKTGVYVPFSEGENHAKENEAREPQQEEKRVTRTKTRQAALSELNNRTAEDTVQPIDLFNIKKEKLSDVHVKKEVEEMPAPTQLPKRKRKKIKDESSPPPARVTRTKTRNNKKAEEEKIDEASKNDSECIIVPERVLTIELDEESVRSTITKTKRSRGKSQEESEQEKKKSRSASIESVRTEYEDAVSTLNNDATYAVAKSPPNPNATVTLNKEAPLDTTVVIEKPKVVQKDELKKPLFNPCEQSPVKKKVEAFEKLTKLNAKSKMVTPVNSRNIPKACNSTGAVNRALNGSTLGSESKSRSVLKASQAEFREREKRREMEALKKREAMLKAQSEEKRKKREEKHMKAQEQREILEKEKLKLLEQQRLKEERTKQLIAEKDLKLQKQREEQEKKRLLAKEKALKQAKLKETTNEIPLYMVTKPPLLPTNDCYDSDDEEFHQRHRAKGPSWCGGSELRKQLMGQECIGERLKNTYFSRKTETVDLREIFENIDPRKLKRTSSAIWRKAPRYTMMPLDVQPEFSEDEADKDFD